LHLRRNGGVPVSWINRQLSRRGEIALGALDHCNAMVVAPAHGRKGRPQPVPHWQALILVLDVGAGFAGDSARLSNQV